MRWAIVGNRGLLGAELHKILLSEGHEVLAFNRSNFDIEDSENSLAKKIETCEFVINAIAYTDVDKAEENLYEANRVNALFPGRLARAATKTGARFFHFSTDYVFDGKAREPYKISSVPNPSTVYGESKYLGEQLVADSGANYSIFRSSWLYGRYGSCFPKTIAQHLLAKDEIQVVDDQVGAPTWTLDLAKLVTFHAQNNLNEQLVHAVSAGQTNWYQFALAVQESLPASSSCRVKNISTEESGRNAKRPNWSVLDTTESQGPQISNWLGRWQVAAPQVLREFI